MNPDKSNDFQQRVLRRAIELEGKHKELQDTYETRSITQLRSVANELELDQTFVDLALREPKVYAPEIGKEGQLIVEQYVAYPPCHMHRAAATYLTTCEAMEIGNRIPDGFTLNNTYDTSKFAYEPSEQMMWTLTGVQCSIVPLEDEGVVLAMRADMVSERLAAIGGTFAVACVTTPIFAFSSSLYDFLPIAAPISQVIMGALGLVIGASIGVVSGRLWWKEQVRVRTKVLRRAVEGIRAMADSGQPLNGALELDKLDQE